MDKNKRIQVFGDAGRTAFLSFQCKSTAVRNYINTFTRVLFKTFHVAWKQELSWEWRGIRVDHNQDTRRKTKMDASIVVGVRT